jgi:hypothetical protein
MSGEDDMLELEYERMPGNLLWNAVASVYGKGTLKDEHRGSDACSI